MYIIRKNLNIQGNHREGFSKPEEINSSGNNKIHRAIKWFLAVILIISGISKIIDPMPVIETINAFVNLPENLIILFATILPIVELTLAVLLISNKYPFITNFSITILFLSFFLFSLYVTFLGVENDCGCFGSLVKSEIGWGMVTRNGFLLTICHVLIKERYKSISNKVKTSHLKE